MNNQLSVSQTLAMAAQHSTTAEFSSRYKFNAKELDQETGWYYYGARYYDPSVSQWLSIDPLLEKYPAFNPYNYTMNNPIMLVDPDGRSVEDTYSVDSKGHITHVDNKKYFDENGNEVDKLIALKNNKEIMVKDGVLDNITSTKLKNVRVKIGKGKREVKNTNTTELKIKGDRNGKKLFEFLAVNTDVEWSHMRFGTSIENGENWVSTSHFEQTEASAPNLLNTRLSLDNLRQHTHSHPKYRGRPSIADRDFALRINLINVHTVFSIYATRSRTYVEYNEKGIMWESIFKD